jgi:hypothetical protein
MKNKKHKFSKIQPDYPENKVHQKIINPDTQKNPPDKDYAQFQN